MKRLFYAMREIVPDDLDDHIMDEVSNVLFEIEKRRRQRTQQPKKLFI